MDETQSKVERWRRKIEYATPPPSPPQEIENEDKTIRRRKKTKFTVHF
jgi:hypothetical protein